MAPISLRLFRMAPISPEPVDREGICTGGVDDVDAKVYVNGTADVDCNGRGIVATRIQYKQYNHY